MIHLGNLVTPFILWTILTTLRSARGVARQMKISSVRPEVQAHLKLYHSSNDYTSLNPRVLFTVEVVVCKSYVSDWKSLATFKSITPRLDSVVVGSMSRRCGTNDLIFVILNSSPGQFKLVFVADIMVCSPLQAFYDIRAAQWADHEWNAEWADNPTRLRTLIPDTGTHPPGMALPRRAWVRLNRLRTGVGRLRSCLYKWGMATAACECGAEEQTVDHVVLQCPIHRPPHGLHCFTVLDHETTEWLLNTCPEI